MCCKIFLDRVYYIAMAALYILTIIIQLVTLGTFTSQYSRTNSFYTDNLGSSLVVCTLYGEGMGVDDKFNVALSDNASCGFVFFGIMAVIIVLLILIAIHVIMAIVGKPKM